MPFDFASRAIRQNARKTTVRGCNIFYVSQNLISYTRHLSIHWRVIPCARVPINACKLLRRERGRDQANLLQTCKTPPAIKRVTAPRRTIAPEFPRMSNRPDVNPSVATEPAKIARRIASLVQTRLQGVPANCRRINT